MMVRAKRATLQQIADEIGISVSTVSRALNNRAQIDPETRDRVQAAADRLGYRVNRSEAPRERAMTMAVITSNGTTDDSQQTSFRQHDLSHIQRMLFTIEQAAQERDYHLVLNSDSGVPGALPSSIRTRFADGALLLGGQFSNELVEQIAALVPTVFVASFLPSGRVHAVHADYRLGVSQAIEHLVGLGHRRIGFVNGPLNTNTSNEKLAGYLYEHYTHSLEVDRSLIVNASGFTVPSGFAAAEQLFEQAHCTAVVVASDILARGVLGFAETRAIDVPGQLSLVSLYNDGEDYLYQDRVRLTRVLPPHDRLARLAVEQLFALIEQPTLTPISIVTSVEFEIGTSSGPVPTS